MERYRGPRERFERERDDHPNVEYFGAGESYRPGGSTGDGPYRPPGRDRPTADSWSAERRDVRRDDRREDIDSYIPSTSARAPRPRSRSPATPFRRRSRSPPARDRGDLFPNRARSPPRRFSPRRDERTRSPPRRRSRSPYARPRSPPDTKRSRDLSPDRRSPKRERAASPERGRFDRTRSPPRHPYSPPRDPIRGGNFRPRSRTPPRRDDRRDQFGNDSWRRRSPSPRGSNNTSRRSSPRPYPDRTNPIASGPRSPPYRSKLDSRDPAPYRPRSPIRREPSPIRDKMDIDREGTQLREDQRANGDSAQPPTGPSASRNVSYDRPPPTGPARGYNQTNVASPPTGPAATSTFAPPTRPRGTAPPNRYDAPARDFSAMRGRGSLTYRAPSAPRAPGYQDGPPSGPRAASYGSRGDYSGSGRGDYSSGGGSSGNSYRGGFGRGSGAPGPSPSPTNDTAINNGNSHIPFRPTASTNSNSTSYPRTQRFNSSTSTPTGPSGSGGGGGGGSSSSYPPAPINPLERHLSTTEKLVPGGKLLPSGLAPESEKKLKLLEAEAEKVRNELAEKQKAKREALNEWDVRERESERDALKSELAEATLVKLTTGEIGGAAGEDGGVGQQAAF